MESIIHTINAAKRPWLGDGATPQRNFVSHFSCILSETMGDSPYSISHTRGVDWPSELSPRAPWPLIFVCWRPLPHICSHLIARRVINKLERIEENYFHPKNLAYCFFKFACTWLLIYDGFLNQRLGPFAFININKDISFLKGWEQSLKWPKTATAEKICTISPNCILPPTILWHFICFRI